jgi:hypothetical protein
MPTVRVVPALDVLEDGHADRRLGREALAIEQLALERGEEALADRVVVGVADRAHRRADAHEFAASPEGERRALTALIGVVDDFGRLPLGERHVECVEHQLAAPKPYTRWTKRLSGVARASARLAGRATGAQAAA